MAMDKRIIDFGDVEKITTIKCKGYQEGDWIIFKSPVYPDYERRFNWKTGEMSIKNDQPGVLHAGSYVPEAFKNLN